MDKKNRRFPKLCPYGSLEGIGWLLTLGISRRFWSNRATHQRALADQYDIAVLMSMASVAIENADAKGNPTAFQARGSNAAAPRAMVQIVVGLPICRG